MDSPKPVESSDPTLEKKRRLKQALQQQKYIADEALISSLYLVEVLAKPLLLEGDAGVGKTEVARSLAAATGAPLIRLQCYEGLGPHQALYDWDYARQLLTIQMSQDHDQSQLRSTIYSEAFLLKRPLLKAISSTEPVVLLIDEIDRADEEFEALLLEILSDFQISIPELGTFKARTVPRVILTSNGIRELSDALRRRCLYHYIDYPDFAKELNIVRTRLPDIELSLVRQLVSFVQVLRQQNLRKIPGIAESIDWAIALADMQVTGVIGDRDAIERTLSCLLKTHEDIAYVHQNMDEIVQAAQTSRPSL